MIADILSWLRAKLATFSNYWLRKLGFNLRIQPNNFVLEGKELWNARDFIRWRGQQNLARLAEIETLNRNLEAERDILLAKLHRDIANCNAFKDYRPSYRYL